MNLDLLSRQLIDRFQHGMPLCPEPYKEMARILGCREAQVMDCLEKMAQAGPLSRIGPVFEHSRAGASTLAAFAVPAERLQQVAERVSQYPEVNHNYAREHFYNLWFVLTGPDRPHIERVLEALENETGLVPLDLPMLTAYRIDLGFALGEGP
ncbi:DNA-binding Lrp family transcriptional regulator [Pseudomonas sp. PvR086]|jgi:DNA-binding Lrp family transcriptional regulator|uniref:Lrp/AsnC family transcriptional regulator n=1 Tax=Pseudomonas TaxID=286 RepID=UPI0007DD280C|nr:MULTISPECIES: Lrp/AsnC family transcriptional regulator [Pseudomonas]ANI59932.1 AsnC family transcriptional regulator [Pseudomonas sp. GR 6-02]MBD9606705.1 Lrp/AsnC family transcriptional regulator [Pseudomonas sp. PDM08]MBD9615733.1 Lrp/AsnC family transcriptional regulator [Pseudomonas sp. PDM07]MDR7104183.1 DNA-binding Lrp family transcriptional regulator [Pseudomonas frederiksbergensis]QDV95209.1 Lrp/AsnC family transcriptional regulator [Pseudomonas sp. ATCC 43928]